MTQLGADTSGFLDLIVCPFCRIIITMKQNQNILLALAAIVEAMNSFSREHPVYLKLQRARQALILEIVNENQTVK